MIDTKSVGKSLQDALPKLTGTVKLPGLDGVAKVYRDNLGIPHIRATSQKDAFFAQGFVTAQDRLWHMEFDRKRGAGRWAEMVGESAVQQDKLMRRFRLEDSAQADYQACSPETRDMFDAYASGVNAFIDSESPLPVEYQITGLAPDPWQPWHGLVAYKVRHILMGVFESKVWRAQVVAKLGPEKASLLFPGFQPGYPVILPPGDTYSGPLTDGLEELKQGAAALNYLNETDAGSNSWVLAGSRTATGKPILAGDSHRALDTPNVYYQNQVACPEFDVIGLSFPGVPSFPHFGHNAYVAWSVTHTSADYQDLYIERFNTENTGSESREYLFQDQWLPAALHRETIKVKGSEDVQIQSWVTRHGPVISGDPEKGSGIAFKYTATEGPSPWADTLLSMLKAEDAPQLIESMRDWMDPCNNFLYADVHGNSGYLCRGRIPIRSKLNGWLPVPGWTGEHEWQGYIPFDDLPRSMNPEQGYVVTANNKPVGDDYPYYISSEFTPGFRAKRVAHRLLKIDKPSVEDMATVHGERVSIPAQAYAKYLQQVAPEDSLSAQARDKLIAWNGEMEADRVEPAIYSAFRDALLREVLEQNLGPELGPMAWNPDGRGLGGFLARLKAHLINLIDQDDRSLLAPGDDWQAMMSRALEAGTADLKRTIGDDGDGGMETWRWDRVHQARPKHTLSAAYPELAGLLDPPPIPTSGDGDTPLAGSYSLSDPATVTGLSVVRYAYDTSDWEKSLWAVPLGSSGHPGSPHYHDQSDTWRKVEMLPMQYDWDYIAAHCETQQTLEPA